MAMRFVQILAPIDRRDELSEILHDLDVVSTWKDTDHPDRISVQVLIPADRSEEVTDRLEDEFSGAEPFRVILLPVEAVIPRPEEEREKPPDSPDDAADQAAQAIMISGRISREELYNAVTESLAVNRIFLAMTMLSSVVAAVGLIRDNTAAIIGAMVIAPLLGPNVAMALGVTLGDIKLLRRGTITSLVGMTVTLAVALAVGLTVAIDPLVSAILTRSQVNLSDLVLALAAGSAGTFAFTAGASSAVIGVMVAVALMPPLVAFGMLLGSGHFAMAIGALLLVSANVICIWLSGMATFLMQGVRPRNWWEEARAKTAQRYAIGFSATLLIILAGIIWWTREHHLDL